eukprot:6665238-Pyramimonas_sp.AAC.1
MRFPTCITIVSAFSPPASRPRPPLFFAHSPERSAEGPLSCLGAVWAPGFPACLLAWASSRLVQLPPCVSRPCGPRWPQQGLPGGREVIRASRFAVLLPPPPPP